MDGKSFYTIKELENYERQLESELPPYYDFEQVGTTHQEIEARILEYWEYLHPVIQDFIVSWFTMWNTTKKENELLKNQKDQKISMLNKFRETSKAKIHQLKSLIEAKQAKIAPIKEELQQKEAQIQSLEESDKENQLGIAELRAELEKELAELNLMLTEMQNRFECTQAKVTQAFENKIMVFESEGESLKEQILAQEARIQDLQVKNQQFKQQNMKLQVLEEKIRQIIDIVATISIN
ncbi:MAG: hypothetical protein ACTSQI_15430 [Candidatus Helarchaeota archaeon]